MTLDGRKVVESLCCIVVSSDRLYSAGLSSLGLPEETLTGSLDCWLGELVVVLCASVISDDLLVAGNISSSRSMYFFTWVTFRRYYTPSASTRTLLPFF